MSQKLRFYIFGPGPIRFGLKISYFELKSLNFFYLRKQIYFHVKPTLSKSKFSEFSLNSLCDLWQILPASFTLFVALHFLLSTKFHTFNPVRPLQCLPTLFNHKEHYYYNNESNNHYPSINI